MEFLSTNFVMNQVENNPQPLNELGDFVYNRTYSRWLNNRGRREYWYETVKRALEFNMALEYSHMKNIGLSPNIKRMMKEAQEIFKNVYQAKQFPSGRTLWIGNGNETVNKEFTSGNFNCFTRDTEFLTDRGIKSFENFDHGDVVNVVNANGKWAPATVRNFGESEIYELQVRNGNRVETIKTTKNHRWYAKNTPTYSTFDIRTTSELSEGDHLRTKRIYECSDVIPSKVGIMHGMVYGDGTYDKKRNHTRIHLIDDKKELLPHFIDGSVSTTGKDDNLVVYGLPSHWKELPSIEMNIEYLYGFLMGLFATDGNNSNNQHTISSSNHKDINKIRDISIVCGINTGSIRTLRELSPFDGSYSLLYEFTLSNIDIKNGFHLRKLHKDNYIMKNINYQSKERYWKVESIVATGEYENVWCVQEPETESFVLANGILTKNCSFLNIKEWSDLGELFYLLMVGVGVGFKSTKKMAAQMPKIRTNSTLLHSDYEPILPEQRLENTKVVDMGNGFAKIYVGDSKEGWMESLNEYFKLLTLPEHEDIHTIKISYNSIRPKGERLKTFGGTASGHTSLLEMFEGIDKVLKNEIDPTLKPIEVDKKGYGNVRPIHILDIGNLIGNNVVIGGVRRTAEIFLFDPDDYESMFAKYGMNGIWTEEQLAQHNKVGKMLDELNIKPSWFDNLEIGKRREGIDHRRMSNNSIAFSRKPEKSFLNLVFEMMQLEGEPGFVNLEEAAKRVFKTLGIDNPTRRQLDEKISEIGLNPCVEIILHDKNVCNLTTINVKSFVNEDGNLDLEGLLQAQKYSTRIGMRMTLVELELPEWNKTQKRDRLLGVSLTGWKDAMDLLNYNEDQENSLKEILSNVAREEADSYAKELRINAPMFVTAVKPEGTLSQVAGGVSSGLHWSHSPYYIRRIRINATDPMVKVAEKLGWSIHAEVGTNNFMSEEDLAKPEQLETASSKVVDFPIKSGAKRTKEEISVDEQFDNYFSFQDLYTEMNTSNTITVKPKEWDQAEKRVWEGWDNFVGVSFLSEDGGTYTLAPYESIDKDRYEKLKSQMKPFDVKILHKYEKTETTDDLEGLDSCESGVCPIR